MATGHDIEAVLGTHELERGCDLPDDIVKGRVYGNPDGPIIVVMGGISATRFISDAPPEQKIKRRNRGWWSGDHRYGASRFASCR